MNQEITEKGSDVAATKKAPAKKAAAKKAAPKKAAAKKKDDDAEVIA